jgi:hypothetical protein
VRGSKTAYASNATPNYAAYYPDPAAKSTADTVAKLREQRVVRVGGNFQQFIYGDGREQQVVLDFARRQRNWRERLGVGQLDGHQYVSQQADELGKLAEHEYEQRIIWTDLGFCPRWFGWSRREFERKGRQPDPIDSVEC